MRLALVLCFLLAGAGVSVRAMPGHQRDEAWCAAHPDTKAQDWRRMCVTRAWCATHWNEDRITRISCDPMRPHADPHLPRITLSQGLAGLRDLPEVERHLDCSPPFHSTREAVCDWGIMRPSPDGTDNLLPPGMKTAKLGLYARIALGPFPITVVRLGVASADSGTITASWNDNGNGPRVTRSASLQPHEIAALISALNQSDFWRSPHEPGHMGPADGEVAMVTVGIAGRQNQVMDSIGDSEAWISAFWSMR